jgi:hypothetical protein
VPEGAMNTCLKVGQRPVGFRVSGFGAGAAFCSWECIHISRKNKSTKRGNHLDLIIGQSAALGVAGGAKGEAKGEGNEQGSLALSPKPFKPEIIP